MVSFGQVEKQARRYTRFRARYIVYAVLLGLLVYTVSLVMQSTTLSATSETRRSAKTELSASRQKALEGNGLDPSRGSSRTPHEHPKSSVGSTHSRHDHHDTKDKSPPAGAEKAADSRQVLNQPVPGMGPQKVDGQQEQAAEHRQQALGGKEEPPPERASSHRKPVPSAEPETKYAEVFIPKRDIIYDGKSAGKGDLSYLKRFVGIAKDKQAKVLQASYSEIFPDIGSEHLVDATSSKFIEMFDQADEIAKEIDSPLVEPTLLLQRRVPATDLSLLGRDNRLPAGTPSKRREKAVIVVLCRNKDLDDIRRTIREFEDRFNRRYLYPYVFINDQPFTSKFMDFVSRSTMAQTEFYLIDEGTWEVPGWINQTAADMARAKMEKDGIIYGGNLNYRHMCRWYSGWFFRHPALAKYDWYWRIEPGVHFYCDINYDPFVYMADNNKHYGFVINLLEIRETIPSLWPMVQLFALKKGIDTSPLLKFFVNEKGEYNGCHFWSNFEIARMDLWRDPLYLEFFDFLDKWGGFYYERWGDAPVHSIYVGLTLRKENVHFFNDIGYKHESFGRCIDEGDLEYICHCPKSEKNFDVSGGSCLGAWLAYQEVDWGVRTCWECELTTAYVKNS